MGTDCTLLVLLGSDVFLYVYAFFSLHKVETPIHDSMGIGNLRVQRAWNEIMNVLANPKGNVGR
jgi:hypothetical protein